MRRFEHGSEWPWLALAAEAERPVWEPRASFWRCGRDALRAALGACGARRLWVPSFGCPEVAGAAAADGCAVLPYPDADPRRPAGPEPDRLAPGDAVLVHNPLGLRAAGPGPASGVTWIEDHTHDPISPWARTSRADWCLASLRKTAPVPGGAALWSPRGHAAPAGESGDGPALRGKLVAMVLKRRYLDGEPVPKAVYRELSASCEAELARGPAALAPSWAAALARAVPHHALRRARARNFAQLAARLEAVRAAARAPAFELLRPGPGAVPYVAALVFDDPEARERTKAALVARDVYPVVLWAVKAAEPACADPAAEALGRRILCLHVDARYDEAELARVSATFSAAAG